MGANRKWLAHARNDAFDPLRKWSVHGSRQDGVGLFAAAGAILAPARDHRRAEKLRSVRSMLPVGPMPRPTKGDGRMKNVD